MKTLQSNFTTPEQSKRLLELGVPADSADCYLTRFGGDEDWEVKVLNNIKYCELEISNQDYCLPCWSAVRLIEIYRICFTGDCSKDTLFCDNIMDVCYKSICSAKALGKLDFSKLEE